MRAPLNGIGSLRLLHDLATIAQEIEKEKGTETEIEIEIGIGIEIEIEIGLTHLVLFRGHARDHPHLATPAAVPTPRKLFGEEGPLPLSRKTRPLLAHLATLVARQHTTEDPETLLVLRLDRHPLTMRDRLHAAIRTLVSLQSRASHRLLSLLPELLLLLLLPLLPPLRLPTLLQLCHRH